MASPAPQEQVRLHLVSYLVGYTTSFQNTGYQESTITIHCQAAEAWLVVIGASRIRADLIEVYKIIHGLSNVNFFTFFEYSDEHRTRGHSLKLQKHRSRLDLRQYFFSERIINVWNKLHMKHCYSSHVELLQTTLGDITQGRVIY